MQVNIDTLCNAKVGTRKHAKIFSYIQGMKKLYRSINNEQYEFWYFFDDIEWCISGSKKYMLDWPLLPGTWPVKIGTNLSRDKVLALKDIGFQL